MPKIKSKSPSPGSARHVRKPVPEAVRRSRSAGAVASPLRARALGGFGLRRGVADACCFYHSGWDVCCAAA
eukprot:10769807-Alexandrium_andersonii.AAC.1